MIVHQQSKAFVRGAVTETSRSYMGCLVTLLVKPAETEQHFFLIEYRSQPGNEPPPHIHLEHDELLYLLDGVLEVYCMDQVLRALAGDAVFLPRRQAHAFYVLSPSVRMLVLTQPGGLDAYFEAMSSAATSMDLPVGATTYTDSDPAHVSAVSAKHGIRMLTPTETAV